MIRIKVTNAMMSSKVEGLHLNERGLIMTTLCIHTFRITCISTRGVSSSVPSLDVQVSVEMSHYQIKDGDYVSRVVL